MSKYLIREMSIDDIQEVIEGEISVFGESLGYDLIYTDLLFNPFALYLVLEIDKKVCGYIGCWLDCEYCDIINFYVLEKYQNCGYGSMLMNIIIESTKNTNCKGICLEVRESNEKAINFYKKFGFKYSRTRENYYSNHENALVLILEVKK